MTVHYLDPALPLFRLTHGEVSVFYAPGHVAASPSEELVRRAEAAQAAWRRLAEAPFAPECLTLYLNNRCNLACGYCFAAEDRAEKRQLFHLVLHGGGWPSGGFSIPRAWGSK